MGTKTVVQDAEYVGNSTREKRIPKHGDEN